jgi:hypothetical protein
MPDPTLTDFITSLLDGSIWSNLKFYLLFVLLSFLGATTGSLISEKLKGKVAKDVWFAQESWKEKYKIYTGAIEATEEIASALWSIITDPRVLPMFPPKQNSTEVQGVAAFPDHQDYLHIEAKAIESLASLSVGIELMLNEEAQEAFKKIKSSRTKSLYVVNMSYFERIKIRQEAASEAKEILIKSAKKDLII